MRLGIALVQLYVLYLYPCRKGQCPQRSWTRIVRLCMVKVCSTSCISGGGVFKMFGGLFAKYRPVSVV